MWKSFKKATNKILSPTHVIYWPNFIDRRRWRKVKKRRRKRRIGRWCNCSTYSKLGLIANPLKPSGNYMSQLS
jgi:hypothetical protein